MTMLSLARDPWRSSRKGESTITSPRREISTWLTGEHGRSDGSEADDSNDQRSTVPMTRLSLQVIQSFTRCSLRDLMMVVRSVVIVASAVRVTGVDGKGTARG